MASAALDRAASQSLFSGEIPRSVLVTAFVLFIANIFASGLLAPLWLDENFSATIAAQPSFVGLIDWCLNELSGPLYYSLLWAWEKLAGDTNVALRIPSFIFTIATPTFLLWRGHEDRMVRYMWALSVALWQPGFAMGTEARPYSLMMFLGCVQAVCFLRLIQAPSIERTAIWASVSSLAVLTHYHAAVISGIQGIAYLVTWRKIALRTWPAAFVLLPMIAWMSWHLQMVLNYASSGYSWYQVLSWKQALFVPLFLCGSVAMLIALALMAPIWAYARFDKARSTGATSIHPSPEMVLICTGLLSATCVVATGLVWPSYSMRYLLPYVSAASLLIPVILRDIKYLVPAAPMTVMLLLIGSALPPLVKHLAKPSDDHRYSFNFEQPSNWIMHNSNVRELVFLWDCPTALLGKPDKLADVGGFFFRREGRQIKVLIPRYDLNADPNPAVSALTNGRLDTAVIWAFDKSVPNTSGLLYPPRLPQDKRWTCRNFGLGSVTVLACVPSARADFDGGNLNATLG